MLVVSPETERARSSPAVKRPAPKPISFPIHACSKRKARDFRPAFMDALRRTLAHYGVKTLDRSPELEESLLWIYKSHQRVERQIAPILALLERRLARVDASAPHADESFRSLLDRIIAITRGTFPSVSDLARELRYRCFEQALFEQARKQVYAQAEDHLAYLAANPEAADRSRESKGVDRMSATAGELLLRAVCCCRSRLASIDVGSNDVSILSRAIAHKLLRDAGKWTLLVSRRNTCRTEGTSTSSPLMLSTIGFHEAVGAMCSCLDGSAGRA